MVSNFETIVSQYPFKLKDGEKILVVALQRGGKAKRQNIRQYWYLESIDELMLYKTDMIDFCETFCTRLYMLVLPRKEEDVCRSFIQENLYNTSVESLHYKIISTFFRIRPVSEYGKYVMYDIDDKSVVDDVVGMIGEENILLNIPTAKGQHIISKRHDNREIRAKYPNEVEVKKDCFVLVYATNGVYELATGNDANHKWT